MTYKAEAVIPLEIGFPTLKTSSFNPSDNNGLLEKSLDFIKEMRENAMVQLAYYQHKLKDGYDEGCARFGRLGFFSNLLPNR